MASAGREDDAAEIRHDQPLATWHDAAISAWLLLLVPISWLAPQRLWTPLSVLISTVVVRLTPRRSASAIDVVRRTCAGQHGLPAPRAIVTNVTAGHVEQHIQFLRESRPGGWKPQIELIGREYIDRALESGKGCIVWVAPMLYSHLVAKKGLHGAGYSATHLSDVDHGWSGSRLARRLTRVRTSAEERYVAERLVMTDGSELKYTRRLYVRLRANSLVSITGTESRADMRARSATGPFLASTMRMATGAPSLALASGASLLPVFVVKRDYDRFEVVVEPELTRSRTGDRHEAVDELVRGYIERIEHYVLEYPHLYADWW